ncbi:MAG: hypothetical protein P1U74_04630 [Legionellaceae bacterium]|nr:hypothetical protein [Legionellaceae bacterium]
MIDSIAIFITNSLRAFIMMDLNYFKKSFHSNLRITAIVNKTLQLNFSCYEELFDQVYYIGVTHYNQWFIKSFSRDINEIIKREQSISSNLILLNFSEGDVEPVAELRDIFHINGLRYNEAQKYRNKLLMKKTVASNGLLVPKGFPLNLKLSAQTLFNQCHELLGLPFIVKPTHLGGAMGISHIESFKEFEYFYLHHLKTVYMAEEKIIGEMFHLDLIVSSSKVKWIGCSQYNIPEIEFIHGRPIGSIPLISKHNTKNHIQNNNSLYDTLINYAMSVYDCFELVDGILHIELFKKETDLYFLEIACRAGGGLITNTYNKMFGVNLIQAQLHYQVGLEYLPQIQNESSYFWMTFPNTYPLENKLLKLNSSYEYFFCNNSVKKIPNSLIGHFEEILVSNKDYGILYEDFFSFN